MATRQRVRAEKRAQNADKRPRAVAKNLGVSPSKVRIVLNLIRGKDYAEADAILKNMPNVGAEYAVKVLESAAANAENNLGMKYDVDNQNLFMAPVGLAYSGNFEMGKKDWQFKPIVELGYTFNMGDKNTDQKVSYNGYGDTFGMDIVDSGYWFGRVGLGFSNKRTDWILGYQYMKSENTRNNKYMLHFNYKF